MPKRRQLQLDPPTACGVLLWLSAIVVGSLIGTAIGFPWAVGFYHLTH